MTLHLSGNVGEQFQVWPLEAATVGIGRSSKNAIQIVDATVSKDHAEIVRSGARWMVRDLGSRNGTRLNGAPVAEPAELKAGDRLEIGHVPLRVTDGHPGQKARLAEGSGLQSSVRVKATQLFDQQSAKAGAGGGALLHLLAQVGQLLVLPRPLEETCDEILAIVERAVPASRLMMLLRPTPDAEPTQVAARYRGGKPSAPMVLSSTIMNMVLEENTSVITTDASADARFQQHMSIVAQAVHSAMAVPLFDNEKVLGLLYTDHHDPLFAYDEHHLEVLTLVANMAAVKISNARLLEQAHARMRIEQELATAVRIQQDLLPADPPEVTGYRFRALQQTCHEVGGDLYDIYDRGDGRVYFLVGDVSGKGMGAALLMSWVLASARALYDVHPDPQKLAVQLNRMLYRHTDPKHFVTAFVAQLRPDSGEVHYVNAGHPEPLLVRRGIPQGLEATGLPLGVLPDFPYGAASVTLEPGETLAVFSDGIPEAQRGEELYETRRLEQVLVRNAETPSLEAVGASILSSVDDFLAGAPRNDDVTLLLVRREAARA